MIDRLTPTARNVALAAVFVLLGWFLWSVRSVLNPLILGYLLAFIAHPLVLSLEKRGWRRRSAVNLIFASFAIALTLIGFVGFVEGRDLWRELAKEDGLGSKVSERVEQALVDYKDEVSWVVTLLPERFQKKPETKKPVEAGSESGASGTKHDTSVPAPDSPTTVSQGATTSESSELHAEDLARMFHEWWYSWLHQDGGAQAADLGLRAAGGAVAFAKSFFGELLSLGVLLLLLPIYTYFLLFELERIHRFVQRYLPRRDRERLVRIGGQIGEVLANFFRGRLLVCLAKGSFLVVGLWIAGVDYALLLGLGTGFLSLIPFIGSAIGFCATIAVAMIDHSLVDALVRVGIVFAAAEVLENYVLIPKILGQSLGLHPIVVIFSLMAGAASLGMFGLLIALPLTATFVILGREFLLPVLAKIADEDRLPPDPKRP